MIVNIDMDSQVPIYEQLKEQITYGILKGLIKKEEKLPSVRQLSSDLGINMHTVSKVYKILENEGFLSINKKKGAFVNVDINKLAINYGEEELLKDIETKILIYREIYGGNKDIIRIIEGLEANGNG